MQDPNCDLQGVTFLEYQIHEFSAEIKAILFQITGGKEKIVSEVYSLA